MTKRPGDEPSSCARARGGTGRRHPRRHRRSGRGPARDARVLRDRRRRPWMPAAPISSPLSTTWFCPGVPASGEDNVGGTVVIANTDDGELTVNVTIVGTEGTPVTEAVTVAARSAPPSTSPPPSPHRTRVPSWRSPAAPVSSSRSPSARCPRAPWPVPWPRARRARRRRGIWPRATRQDGSREQLVVMNPYPTAADRAIRFATQDGTRGPTDLQAESIPPFSVRVSTCPTSLRARRAGGARVSIAAIGGQIPVPRVHTYAGADRRGYAVTLARAGQPCTSGGSPTARSPRASPSATASTTPATSDVEVHAGAPRHRVRELRADRPDRGPAGPGGHVHARPTSRACPPAVTRWSSGRSRSTPASSSSGRSPGPSTGMPTTSVVARRRAPLRGRLRRHDLDDGASASRSRRRARWSSTTSTPRTPWSPCRRSPPEGIVNVPGAGGAVAARPTA